MVIEILTIFYFIFFYITNLTFLKICEKIMDKARFNSKVLYGVAFLNSTIFSIIVYGFNQAPTITYLMVLFGSIIELSILFKNNFLGKLMCSFSATLFLVCIESIAISSCALILNTSLGVVTHNHQLLFSLIVVAWFICMITALCIIKFVKINYIKIINQNKEQTLFMLGFLFAATAYLTLNSFIYGNANDMNAFYLALHQIVTPFTWLSVLLLAYILLIRFDILHGYKVKSDILQKTIEKEKMLNQFIINKIDIIYEIDCTENLILRRIVNGEDKEVEKFPPYEEYLRNFIEKRILDNDRALVWKTASVFNLLTSYKSGFESHTIHFKELDNRGVYRWMEMSITVQKNQNNENVIALLVIKDIDAEKTQLLESQDRAERDSLVGAYNKLTTQVKIEELLKHTRKGALFILDIDNFKGINDTKGHPFGDKVLQYLYKRIANTFREQDIIGRVGGDEFIIFLNSPPNVGIIENRAKELCQDIHVPFTDEKGESITVTISVGISLSPQHGNDFESLYSCADKALYNSKRKGKNTYTIYEII